MTQHGNTRYVLGRIVLKTNCKRESTLIEAFCRAMKLIPRQCRIRFLVMPGGALMFKWPTELSGFIDPECNTNQALRSLQDAANEAIGNFLRRLPVQTLRRFADSVAYLTIGMDSQGPNNDVELVAIYDLRRGKVVHWTGKSHPVSWQQRRLLRVKDLDSHFARLGGHRVVVLGCHDLNLYSPRAAGRAKGWKKANITKFMSRTHRFHPDVIIQHPHETDTPNIWNLCWRTVENAYPTVGHFASGIRYVNSNGGRRSTLARVLAKTKKGSVIDLVV